MQDKNSKENFSNLTLLCLSVKLTLHMQGSALKNIEWSPETVKNQNQQVTQEQVRHQGTPGTARLTTALIY